MQFPLYIAKRYFFSRKTHNVINIISAISMLGIAIGSFALIVVLSAFNGLQDLVQDMYSRFDSDIRITAAEGKTFALEELPLNQIHAIDELQYSTRVLEENVLMKYKDKQSIATIKGVDNDFLLMSSLDSVMIDGDLLLHFDSIPAAILGYGIASDLAVYVNGFDAIRVYAAKRGMNTSFSPEKAFNISNILPAGVFSINPDFDDKYVLVPFEFAAGLLQYKNRVTAIEIGLKPGSVVNEVKAKIAKLAGSAFEVKTRYERNELIFKTNRIEKWVTFLILTFILIIATFNVISSLTMLIIDKKEDIYILKGMGAGKTLIRGIFLWEGILINFTGGMIGMLVGALLCWGQQTIGFIRLHGTVVEYYPVQMNPLDFIAVLTIVMSIGFLSSWLPVRYLTRKYF